MARTPGQDSCSGELNRDKESKRPLCKYPHPVSFPGTPELRETFQLFWVQQHLCRVRDWIPTGSEAVCAVQMRMKLWRWLITNVSLSRRLHTKSSFPLVGVKCLFRDGMDFITQMSNPDWLFSWKVETQTSLTSWCVESPVSTYGLL